MKLSLELLDGGYLLLINNDTYKIADDDELEDLVKRFAGLAMIALSSIPRELKVEKLKEFDKYEKMTQEFAENL